MRTDKPSIQNLPTGVEEANRVRRALNPVSPMIQMANAAEIELRIHAKLKDMEARGIVQHNGMDGWFVLDQKRYIEEMGMSGPEKPNENR